MEALLTRWGPDGIGKLGGRLNLYSYSSRTHEAYIDPHWANPIKNYIRHQNQARAINQVVNALKPSIQGSPYPELHVVNGISSATSSSLTTAARENVVLNPHNFDGLPARPGGSTLRWGGGLQSHPEENEDQDLNSTPRPEQIVQRARVITPSLATLEKAVAARIYFENLYFPLLRQPNSREQRRLAMEGDMAEMQLVPEQKEYLRARWRQNETDYLRERRQKVDASAFVKLKTIGHGKSPFAQPSSFLIRPRCVWRGFPCQRKVNGKSLRDETGKRSSSRSFSIDFSV